MATRKVKDAKDITTDELIYFRGHAKVTYMSDGRSVEDAINASVGGGVTEDYVDDAIKAAITEALTTEV